VDAAEFAAEVESHRSYLMRIAQLELRDRESAEDAVQETLLAALAAREGFSGKSTLKTWLTGILKHKIVDTIRRRQREPLLAGSFEEELDLDDFDALFKSNGAWDTPPASWGDPEAALGQRQFFDIVDFCLEKLPPNTGRVFMMREVLGLETDEICKELRITANNLWVILYRARVSLRQCLEQNWFAGRAVAP
jgi:RNA polymerase sigma-70 factor, ECF subfamily